MPNKRLIDGAALADKLRTRKVMSGDKVVQDAYETAMWDAIDAQEITLNNLRDEVYADAVKHGLWEWANQLDGYLPDVLFDCVGLIINEVSELEDEYKNLDRFTEELADVIIMSLSVAGKLGIDIDAAVRRKIEFNKTRPWKHGKE